MAEKSIIFVRATIVSFVTQCLACYRIHYTWHRVRDAGPPDNWYLMNILLLSIAIAVMTPVIWRERWTHRFIAALFCIYPVLEIYEYARWSIDFLSQPAS